MEKQPNNIRVSAKINKDLAFELCNVCEKLNVTQSTFIRQAIEYYIELKYYYGFKYIESEE